MLYNTVRILCISMKSLLIFADARMNNLSSNSFLHIGQPQYHRTQSSEPLLNSLYHKYIVRQIKLNSIFQMWSHFWAEIIDARCLHLYWNPLAMKANIPFPVLITCFGCMSVIHMQEHPSSHGHQCLLNSHYFCFLSPKSEWSHIFQHISIFHVFAHSLNPSESCP